MSNRICPHCSYGVSFVVQQRERSSGLNRAKLYACQTSTATTTIGNNVGEDDNPAMKSELVPLAYALQSTPLWLSPYARLSQQLLQAANSQSVVAALNAARSDHPESARFVDHSALPTAEPYESFVARTGCVPTRENLHDLFNGLMWLTYPQTKRRLNVLQAEQIAQHGVSGSRGSLRDALTVFDENAAILQAPADLVEALRQRDWKTLFVARRAQWQSARLVLFGHALMEKLTQPRKGHHSPCVGHRRAHRFGAGSEPRIRTVAHQVFPGAAGARCPRVVGR